jgi:hypothetical protein
LRWHTWIYSTDASFAFDFWHWNPFHSS